MTKLTICIAIEGSVPTGLKANVRVVHRDQAHSTDGSISPVVRRVVIDLFSDRVLGVDVEDMHRRLPVQRIGYCRDRCTISCICCHNIG